MFKVHSLHWPRLTHCAAAKYVFSLVGGRICNGHAWESQQKFPPHPPKKRGRTKKTGNQTTSRPSHPCMVSLHTFNTQLTVHMCLSLWFPCHLFPIIEFICLNQGFFPSTKHGQIYQPWMIDIVSPYLLVFPASPRCWRKTKMTKPTRKCRQFSQP